VREIDYRGIIAGLEGLTGKKAVDSDATTVKNHTRLSHAGCAGSCEY
jgi:hypothetical protein